MAGLRKGAAGGGGCSTKRDLGLTNIDERRRRESGGLGGLWGLGAEVEFEISGDLGSLGLGLGSSVESLLGFLEESTVSSAGICRTTSGGFFITPLPGSMRRVQVVEKSMELGNGG